MKIAIIAVLTVIFITLVVIDFKRKQKNDGNFVKKNLREYLEGQTTDKVMLVVFFVSNNKKDRTFILPLILYFVDCVKYCNIFFGNTLVLMIMSKKPFFTIHIILYLF